MKTAVLDATDLSIFEKETFDIVLNMGPFYHLINFSVIWMNIEESKELREMGNR